MLPGMVTVAPGEQLLGRQRECGVLDRLREAARAGHGGVLVVHGEAGVGKTALLEYAVEAARAFRVARTSESRERWSSRSRRFSSCAHRSSS